MSPPVGVAVLGSTGSIGRQALDVVRAYPERFRAVALVAGAGDGRLLEQVREHRPAVFGLADPGASACLRARLGPEELPGLLPPGEDCASIAAALPEVELVVAAVVGRAGLPGVLAAARAGKRLALANKEALVMSGELVMGEARRTGALVVPVDSEHAALAQLLEGLPREQLHKLTLTASGGPFLRLTPAELARVAAEDALAHPTWSMGAKISVDSASMMNKGFEVLEAHWLFELPLERIEVLVHPESLVHGLLQLKDGAWLAHLCQPDMRQPIAWAMARPARLALGERLPGFAPLDLAAAGRLTFEPLDDRRFPAVGLCRAAQASGGGAPAALSVADEVAVQAFLAGRIPFPRIAEVLAEVLLRFQTRPLGSLEDVLAAGEEGARLAREALAGSPA
ncbi:MAG TPA: 1-deoxy-D-xylulose-5-phosphate reductoisomerase [Myxococcota bacterium]|nr:1-deoxy-D-xylulose-5-phosphate reductoisomerase [Myxococcota bacterium]HRY95250.1 1-deoxy-D-xylulose-5-phosphate reductoisomerase [Myxococcota bacterium]